MFKGSFFLFSVLCSGKICRKKTDTEYEKEMQTKQIKAEKHNNSYPVFKMNSIETNKKRVKR